MLGKEPVLLSSTSLGPSGLLACGERSRTAEQRQGAAVTGQRRQPGVDEGLLPM
jgi:hypothetical protein